MVTGREGIEIGKGDRKSDLPNKNSSRQRGGSQVMGLEVGLRVCRWWQVRRKPREKTTSLAKVVHRPSMYLESL